MRNFPKLILKKILKKNCEQTKIVIKIWREAKLRELYKNVKKNIKI